MSAQVEMEQSNKYASRDTTSPGQPTSRVIVTAALVVVAAAALIAVGWWWRSHGGAGSVVAAEDVIVTTLGPTGFDPSEIAHKAGSFHLKVINQSKQPECDLQLYNEGGDKLAEGRITDKVRFWKSPVDLGPGTYTLRDASHSGWTCRIVISQ